ncbi:hypothetical protein BDN70DRAFT_906426 [Pholiota conissans]|uniref:Uncharacterized protein n=1 Tax=Pholiota conissans TaxID=109636 RepID=A0A9P5Z088_9AGAR|nr:hypothetical protein BDN70DRAFT_906426 [Pholiota conissans]
MSETLVTFSIDDTSPEIAYLPLGDTLSTPDLFAGWNPYYTLSGFASAQGAVGNGTSQHITSLDGASLVIEWSGTGITLLGNATQSSYSITLDSSQLSLPSPSSNTNPNILADIQNLADAPHTLRLTAHMPSSQGQGLPGSSMLVFDQALVFSSPVGVDEG